MADIEVLLFLEATTAIGTNLWAAEKVIRLLSGAGEITDERLLGLYGRRLQQLCDANFRAYMPKMVKREYGKTYGIHLERYRLAGFFDRSYRDFIALECFVKKKQRNDSRMNALYQKVDAVREAGTWTR